MFSPVVLFGFRIIRIDLSQMLPLPRLSRRTPCCLTSVPAGNTCTTFCSILLSTKCLVQFIMLSIVYLKWDEFLYILHSDSVLWRRGCHTVILRRYCTTQKFSGGGALALPYGTAVLATIFLVQGCCVATSMTV